MKDKLLIIISTENEDSILKFPLMYSSVALPREYWKEVHVMFWGASVKQARDNRTIRNQVRLIQKTGVVFSACVVCAQEFDAVSSLEEIGIACTHTGELLTEALKSDTWSVLTI